MVSKFRSPHLFYLLVHSMCRGCLFSLDHTQTHTTVGRTPLDDGSARRRDLYLTTQTLYKRQTSMPPGGIRTHDPRKRSAADVRLRPRGQYIQTVAQNCSCTCCQTSRYSVLRYNICVLKNRRGGKNSELKFCYLCTDSFSISKFTYVCVCRWWNLNSAAA
jgi:hypothetical protein